MPDVHLKYGGSTATRTLNCPAWIELSAALPKIDRSSAAADRGTMLHGVMERIYRDGVTLDAAIAEAQLDDNDADAVLDAHAATEQYLDDIGAVELICEEMVTLAENIGGSADMIAAGPGITAIIDYKFGYVPVTDVDQFKLYAICGRNTPAVADMFEGQEIESVIIQPAVSDKATVHQHSPEELADFQNRFLLAVERAEHGGCEPCPGDWCKYCPAAATCPAKRAQVAGFLAYDPKVQQQLADAMNLVEQMKEQIKAIEAEVFYNLEGGLPVPGWKLVEKRSTRKWIDEEKVWHWLRHNRHATREQYVVEKLKSPAQVEKALGKAVDIRPYVTSASSGNTIAAESDKRPAVQTRGSSIPDSLGAILAGKKA